MDKLDILSKSSETLKPLDRRDFLKKIFIITAGFTSITSVSHLAYAQDDDPLEVEVFGEKGDEVKLVDDIEKQIQKQKMNATADTLDKLGNMATMVGIASLGLAVGLGPLAAAAGIIYLVAAVIFHVDAMLLRWMAADPPRPNYKVVMPMSEPLLHFEQFSNIDDIRILQLLVYSNNQAHALRNMWDSLEYYQGAKLAKDTYWINFHSINYHSRANDYITSIKYLPEMWLDFVEGSEDVLLRADLSFDDLVKQSKRMEGQNIMEVEGVREIYQQYVNWDSNLLTDIRSDVRALIQNTRVREIDLNEFRSFVRDLRSSVQYFRSL